MAKLGSYFGLCPLIEQQNLLGISEDATPGHVLVTLGKNIAIKCKLSDQKQLHSWRTKDKFSSPVIFDKETSKYVATFNSTHLRMWNDQENLDKLKKYKLSKQIYTILNCEGISFIIFGNGGILTLKMALEDRKSLIVDDVIDVNSEDITDVIYLVTDARNLIYIGLFAKSQYKTTFLCTAFLNGTVYQQFNRINLNRDDSILTGYVLCQMYDNRVHLLTLWSDGKLFARSLPGCHSEEENSADDLEPYGTAFANIESVSCKQFVTMTAINNEYIAMYGAECNQEGASLVIYNLQFKVSQSRQTFKMFSNCTRIWYIENNLLLCVGQNLAVVPLYLNAEQLAALVGSHLLIPNTIDQEVAIVQDLKIGKWDTDICITDSDTIPSRIKTDVLNLLEQGLPESVICEHLIALYIENEDAGSITNSLIYFGDIPEACIVKLIQFYITAHTLLFKNNKTPGVKNEIPLPEHTHHLIDMILKLPCSDVLLLPYIRRELDVNSILLLLQYICHLLSKDGHCLPDLDVVDTENKLIMWGCVLLDSSYQKLLLTCDDTIPDILKNFQSLLQDHLDYIEDLKEISSLLTHLNNETSMNNNSCKSGFKYSVEQINLC